MSTEGTIVWVLVVSFGDYAMSDVVQSNVLLDSVTAGGWVCCYGVRDPPSIENARHC